MNVKNKKIKLSIKHILYLLLLNTSEKKNYFLTDIFAYSNLKNFHNLIIVQLLRFSSLYNVPELGKH